MIGSLLGKIPKADRHEPGHFLFDDIVKFKASRKNTCPEDQPRGGCRSHQSTRAARQGLLKALVSAMLMWSPMSFCVQEWVRVSKNPGEPVQQVGAGRCGTPIWCSAVVPQFWPDPCHCSGVATRPPKLVCNSGSQAGNPPFTEVLQGRSRNTR